MSWNWIRRRRQDKTRHGDPTQTQKRHQRARPLPRETETLCARPLDQWLPIAAPSGFFAFADPGPDRRIASWFLAAAPENPFVAALERKLTAYWAKRTKASAYFYFHYLAEHLIRTDPAAAQVWLRTPRISARPMLTLHAALKAGESFAPGRFDCAPVHKLSWKGGPSWDEVSAALRLQG